MHREQIQSRLRFLREAEALKSVVRSAYTSKGRPESTADHSWRLSLLALVFEDALSDLDMLKVLKLCVVHDLGEAIHGDVPAVQQHLHADKRAQEREDLLLLTQSLEEPLRSHVRALWEEYESGVTAEAQVVKALDKLETLLQHNQGLNPPDFDYAFNLHYGRKYTDATPLFQAIRALIDEDTRQRVQGQSPAQE